MPSSPRGSSQTTDIVPHGCTNRTTALFGNPFDECSRTAGWEGRRRAFGRHKTGFVRPRERVRAASAGRPKTMGTNNDVNEGGETKLGIGGTERGKGEDGTQILGNAMKINTAKEEEGRKQNHSFIVNVLLQSSHRNLLFGQPPKKWAEQRHLLMRSKEWRQPFKLQFVSKFDYFLGVKHRKGEEGKAHIDKICRGENEKGKRKEREAKGEEEKNDWDKFEGIWPKICKFEHGFDGPSAECVRPNAGKITCFCLSGERKLFGQSD
ncbi:hypothetical protein niasHT_030161 [Heterodera trifolii]|uniref:Uncharacterized protein n=1 Tax=Heterodera trifolii TaxID=157864 RepID=A0ABD2K2Q2_9BILA